VIRRDCVDVDADVDVVGAAVAAGVGARAPERIGYEIGSGNAFEEVGVPSLCLCLFPCLGLWLRWDLCLRYLDSNRFLDQKH